MRYVVLCHTNTIDRSRNGRDVIHTHEMLRAVNRRDAQMLVNILAKDDDTIEDGPFLISRCYEVAGVVHSPRGKVTLSLSDMEMIASEVTNPGFTAMAAE